MLNIDGLELTLTIAALVAGFTGSWSPCGFSMIETIGPVGHRGGLATTLPACVTFTLGALAGGVVTFGALGVTGALLHGADQRVAYVAAAAIALAAAAAELRGLAVLPQVRRQLPEHWRRVMPMPVAAGLYGVLLGLGFTTFVLTFGVFALAGIVLAVGEPAVGLTVGLAFGIGRALPIILVAPVADRPRGIAITEAMAGRPGIYRGFRAGDGVALIASAAALIVAVPAGAAKTEARPAADPSVGGDAVAFERPNGTALVRRGGGDVEVPGHDPALGDGRLALIAGGRIAILAAKGLSRIGGFAAPGADAVAVSGRWVVWRARHRGRDFLRARRVSNPANPGPQRGLGRSGRRGQLGRPALDGNRLVYARANRNENLIVRRVLGAKRPKRSKSTLVRSTGEGLSNPSLRGNRLLYVRHTRKGDKLKLTRAGSRHPGRTLLSRAHGTLWSTALSKRRAYVTLIHGSRPRQKILSVGR